MKKRNPMIERPLALTATLVLALAAGGCAAPTDDDPEEENLGAVSSAMMRPKPRFICDGFSCVSGSMSGVGTSSCSGSETTTWGNSTSGGRQYVSCSSWSMSEWGPGWHASDYGTSDNGVIVTGSSDTLVH
jgi:hypothetical protein